MRSVPAEGRRATKQKDRGQPGPHTDRFHTRVPTTVAASSDRNVPSQSAKTRSSVATDRCFDRSFQLAVFQLFVGLIEFWENEHFSKKTLSQKHRLYVGYKRSVLFLLAGLLVCLENRRLWRTIFTKTRWVGIVSLLVSLEIKRSFWKKVSLPKRDCQLQPIAVVPTD